jgi:hypothetical protein
MDRLEKLLDALATPGGSIALLGIFTLLFAIASVHIMHHGGYSEQMITTFTGLLTGFAGALLAALSTRSKPPANGPKPPA